MVAMKMNIDFVCFCCRQDCNDYYTMYQGYLMCEYCLDDWLKQKFFDDAFESWCEKHKKEIEKEMIDDKEKKHE